MPCLAVACRENERDPGRNDRRTQSPSLSSFASAQHDGAMQRVVCANAVQRVRDRENKTIRVFRSRNSAAWYARTYGGHDTTRLHKRTHAWHCQTSNIICITKQQPTTKTTTTTSRCLRQHRQQRPRCANGGRCVRVCVAETPHHHHQHAKHALLEPHRIASHKTKKKAATCRVVAAAAAQHI